MRPLKSSVSSLELGNAGRATNKHNITGLGGWHLRLLMTALTVSMGEEVFAPSFSKKIAPIL
jgi:hypothetical protein